MSDSPNVVFVLSYVQSGEKISKNKTLQAKYEEKRKFYSCNNGIMDYLRYVDEGSRDKVEIMEQDYVGYSGNEEKSSGVFNGKGLLSKKERTDLRNQLRETKSTIWHGIISFEENFGKRYVASYDEAYRLMKIELPKFLREAGFDPQKITWFAGLHENTDNRHIHFSFFENEPSRYSAHKQGYQFSEGRINARHFEHFKVACEQRLTDIFSEIKVARKDVTDLTRNLLFSKENKLRYQNDLQLKLRILAEQLPKNGRLSYDSENMKALKPQIKSIIDTIFKIDKTLYLKFENYCKKVKEKDKKTLEMLKKSKISESEWDNYLVSDKYIDDVYRRLGNQVINMVRIVRDKEKPTKNRLAAKRMRKRTIGELLEISIKMNSIMEAEANRTFREYLEKLEEENLYTNGAIDNEL